jgi:hypothetical protein
MALVFPFFFVFFHALISIADVFLGAFELVDIAENLVLAESTAL